MSPADKLKTLAFSIDPERARMLSAEFGSRTGASIAVLLGSAYPALTPSSGFHHDALASIEREGFLVARRRQDLVIGVKQAIRADDPELGAQALRRLVWREKARIALREVLPISLGGASLPITARELSALADAAFEAALLDAERAVRERFGPPLRTDGREATLVSLGMGKLGGQELNAGSDIDIIFVYDTDDGGGKLSLHDHFTRVARRAVSTIETPSNDGFIWRVDLRLRPEGSQGPIVNSVAAAERYYETWGRLWERAALLRARPMAGDLALGDLFVREVAVPFVYRHAVDAEIADALADLLLRSRAELSSAPERDLKLGPGGIREAEFFVQALQLIWGGQERSLRVQGTLPALARLRSQGLVSDREAREIADAYVFLRRVEHRVQWASGVQTHLLPEGADELGRLARSVGFSRSEDFTRELARVRTAVHETFTSLSTQRPRTVRRHQSIVHALDDAALDLGRLSEQTFGSADVGEHLLALARRPDGLLGALSRERFPELAERLIDALEGCSDPEQAARYLRAFVGRFLAPSAYVSAIGEDPRALRRLVTVLGASAFVGDAIVNRPELCDVILFGGGAVSDPRAAVAVEIEAYQRATGAEISPEERQQEFVGALRVAKRRVMVEVAVADLAGSIGTRQATRILSELADEELSRAVGHALGGSTLGLGVLAMGKLGGRDIGYGSDLDVIFIYDPKKAPSLEEAPAYFARSAQRVIRAISEPHPAGPGYELDTRLRPSGSHGLLVTSLKHFARYHSVLMAGSAPESGPAVLSSGAAWERQALLRARACCGDAELLDQAIEIATRAAYEAGAPEPSEIHHLRKRMETELARERAGRYDLKTGSGGLLDIEFASQWLQMKHGLDPRVRTPDTADALEALHDSGYLDRDAFEAFRDGYRFLRRLEQRIHVRTGTSSALIDTRAPGLPELARGMGFQESREAPAVDQLLSRYKSVTSSVRAAYERVLGVSASPSVG